MSRCFHLFTFQSPPGEHWQIWGRSPPWQICVLSIYVLLNLFLSAAWDWTRTERWLADKLEGREKKKAVFSTSMEYVVQWQSPCSRNTFLLWTHAGQSITVFGPLYVVWMLKLLIVSSTQGAECTHEKEHAMQIVAEITTHPPLMAAGSQVCIFNRLRTRSIIFNTNNVLVLKVPVRPRNKSSKCTLRWFWSDVCSPLHISPRHNKVVKQAPILYWILTFINHTCLWVNSQLNRFNKRRAGMPRQSLCFIYTSVREIIMEILRGRWTLITAQNKSRGDMKIDRRFFPCRLQVEWGIETTLSVRSFQVILLLGRDSDYAG